jgi:hypothetical protein
MELTRSHDRTQQNTSKGAADLQFARQLMPFEDGVLQRSRGEAITDQFQTRHFSR